MNPTTPSLAAPDAVFQIAELARQGVPKHTPINLNDWPSSAGVAPRLIWPDRQITDLEGALPRPLRKRAHAALGSMASFIDYVRQHRTQATAIHGDADEKGGGFTAIIDYHEANRDVPGTAGTKEMAVALGAPAWAEHRATLALQPTPEWARWLGICGKDLDQRTFAEFIEDNAADVVAPEATPGAPNAADLMQVATTLQVKTDVRFASSVNLQNGQVQLRYEEMINGSWGGENAMAVPQAFWIGIVPFRGGDRYMAKIRLRYRGTGGKANFRLEMERPHKIVEAAFRDTKAIIETETGIKVWIGELKPQARPVV